MNLWKRRSFTVISATATMMVMTTSIMIMMSFQPVYAFVPKLAALQHCTNGNDIIVQEEEQHRQRCQLHVMESVKGNDVTSLFLSTSGTTDAASGARDEYNDENEKPSVSTNTLTANELRNIKVMNVHGESVPLGNAMGNGTSIVIFLRHLGCSWCWSYVRAWLELQMKEPDTFAIEGSSSTSNNDNNKDNDKGSVTGPIFVSIGDEVRLTEFLKKNPKVVKDQFFVDGYDFAAFREAGFGRFDDKPKEVVDNVKAKPIQLGGIGGWLTFLTSFAPLAPVTEDMKFPENLSPEGLFWVGGTFIVHDNDIIYRWDDRISGDHPEAIDILTMAKDVTTTMSIRTS